MKQDFLMVLGNEEQIARDKEFRRLQPGEPNYGLTQSEHLTGYGWADEAGFFNGEWYDGGEYQRGEHGCPWEECDFYETNAVHVPGEVGYDGLTNPVQIVNGGRGQGPQQGGRMDMMGGPQGGGSGATRPQFYEQYLTNGGGGSAATTAAASP